MNQAENSKPNRASSPAGVLLPISPDYRLGIVDRDATIISSWEIAFGCYLRSFELVISRYHPESSPLSFREYTLQYNPFRREEVYLRNYPRLDEEGLKEVGKISWNYYLENYGVERFNRLIPGMDSLLRGLRGQGRRIAILTLSYEEGKWLKHYDIPVDGHYSVLDLRRQGIVKEGKEEAIAYILREMKTPPEEAFTLGDSPKDHSPRVLSIGAGFGLGNEEARRLLQSGVDIYAPDVEALFAVFGLPAPDSLSPGTDQKV